MLALLVVLLGVAVLTAGLWLLSPPLALAVLGGLLIVGGLTYEGGRR